MLTASMRFYVSKDGRALIKRLEQVGFDPDLAFEMASSSMSEEQFYDIPLDDGETQDE